MIIVPGKTVVLTYTLSLDNGQVIDTNVGDKPLTYIHGEEVLLFGIEQKLEGKRTGDSFRVSISPEDGFGEKSEDAVFDIPLEEIPEEGRKKGAVVTAVGPQGQELEGRVTSVSTTAATLDFNHPLAGKTLYLEITVLQVN
ncbi:MAG: peptidylprolyl isomerase [Desulfobulbus sp.]|nr:peptidylprolyl isomerase [Desulfobulbus sp.]